MVAESLLEDLWVWVGIDSAHEPSRVDRSMCFLLREMISIKQKTLLINMALVLVSDEVIYNYN